MKLSVVVAAYDEAENVEALFRRLEHTLNAMPGVVPEAIFVVEGRDGTRELLARASTHLPWVRILYREDPTGLGAAFRRGFDAVAADADYVVTLDADLNHQPEEIPRLVEAAVDGDCDVVIGSRFVADSEVEGTPLWKRGLSGSVNRMMSVLYGVSVRDKTSGFRVYRAGALRQLDFRGDGFSFLPELLINAHDAGLSIVEVPIRFVFRREGVSKMGFASTSWSYLRLLWSRFDRWSLAAAALLLLGIVVRLLATFPTHKYYADADGILSALCAFKVLAAETPVFFSGYRIGSLGCHLTAGSFAVFGSGRAALSLGPLAVWAATMVLWYLLSRELLGRRMALVALVFIAVPTPWVSFTTYFPNGYPEIFLLCTAILSLALYLGRRRTVPLTAAGALGVVAGLGWWTSILTLVCSGPAAVWLLWRRPEIRRPAALAALATGAAAGAAPWLVFNLRWDFYSLKASFPMRSAGELTQYVDNLRYFFVYSFPELVAGWAPTLSSDPETFFSALRFTSLGAHVAAVAFLFLPAGRRAWAEGGGRTRKAAWLLALVAAAVVLVNVVSAAGSARGGTVRYVLPLVLLMPLLLAVLLRAVAARSRGVAAAVAAAVFSFNLAGVDMPWEPLRLELRDRLARDDALIEQLRTANVDVAMGSYWQVYPINYVSRGEIAAVPFERNLDVYAVEQELDPQSTTWAIVDGRREAPRRWARLADLPWKELNVKGSYWVALVERPPEVSVGEYVERLRRAYEAAP